MTDSRTPRPLFRLLGFPVYVPLSAWLGIALIAFIYSPAFEARGGMLATLLFAVGLYVTVVVHELAHAIAARRAGHDVLAIILGIFGGATLFDDSHTAYPKQEFRIAVVGPLSSIALGFALDASASSVPFDAAATVVAALGFMNIALGFMNLLPAPPLDGGHVFEATVWRITGSRRKGVRATAVMGWLLGTLFLAIGLVNVEDNGIGLPLFLGMMFTFEASNTWRRSALYP